MRKNTSPTICNSKRLPFQTARRQSRLHTAAICRSQSPTDFEILRSAKHVGFAQKRRKKTCWFRDPRVHSRTPKIPKGWTCWRIWALLACLGHGIDHGHT